MKLLGTLNNVIKEAKRYEFQPETYAKIKELTDKLWKQKNKKYTKKTLIDVVPIKLASGVEGLVRIIVNPRLKYVGELGTRPQTSRDPADLYIEVNPRHYESKKNLYLTLYHEMIHASDPTRSYLFSPKYELTYDPEKEEKYWGHPIEFFAMSNDFLEGMILEYKRRIKRISKKENLKYLKESIKNIASYFARNEPLNRLASEILTSINDEYLDSDKFVRSLKDISIDFPGSVDVFRMNPNMPYYLHYIEMIKQHNPEIWKKFLSMFYTATGEVKSLIEKRESEL